ncbi:hypothetical protein EV175_001176 [Coemansia sp. RSA 1933]|nr:hypothetical protein EV175_001176 [Coemansia sp. RSA 1933]
MGRLSLAIGRHKEGGGDGSTKPRHLRTSIRGILGIPASARASVDLGEISDERHGTPRRGIGASKLSREQHSYSTAVNTGSRSAAIIPQMNASHTTLDNTAPLSAGANVPENDDYSLLDILAASRIHPRSVSFAPPPPTTSDAHDGSSNTEAKRDSVFNAQATTGAPAQRRKKPLPPTTNTGAPMHAHADIAPISSSLHSMGSATADQFAAMESYSIDDNEDGAMHGRASRDDERHGWRRRGSLLGSRLAMPLRKEGSAGNAGSGRILIRKESTPLFGSGKPHHFWRSGSSNGNGNSSGNSAHRNSINANDDNPPPLPMSPPKPIKSIARQERTHRSSSVPFITPILTAKESRGSLFSNDSTGGASHMSATSPASRMPMASPYLRAVSSGLARSATSNSNSSGGGGSTGILGRMNQSHRSKSIITTRPAQERLPRMMLSGSYEGNRSHGPPSPLALSVPSDKKTAATAPMTFLVSPRPRAGSGAKRGIAAPIHTLNRSSTSSREFNLCKRTLSSATIPSLDLNAPSSPKAFSGGVDMSEFGVATASAETRSNLPLPPSPASSCTPARSVASISVGATFEPLREASAEDEGNSSSQTVSGATPAENSTSANEAPSPHPVLQLAQGLDSKSGNPGSTDAVHETHHMEVQHDPRTGRKMINQYMIIRELGRGTHGKVKLAFDTISGEYYAIKVIDKESQDRRLRPNANSHNARRAREAAAAAAQGSGHRRSRGYLRIDFDKMEKVKREIAILKKCRHPNVVRLREVIDDAHARRIYLVIEFMDQGEIVWRDSSRLPVMSHGEARSVFRDLVLGVEYLHYVGILHRDLKPQNLLRNKAGTVKISDFGVSFLSRRMSKTHLKADQNAGNNVSASDASAALIPKSSQNAHDTTASPLVNPSAHKHTAAPSPLRPLGMRPAKQSPSLHRYASQPVMNSSSSKLANGPVLHRKASVLSSSSKNLLTASSNNSRDSDRNPFAGDFDGLNQEALGGLLQISDRGAVPATQSRKQKQDQRPFSQSIQWPATMGMTNEFGHRKASLPLSVRPATDQQMHLHDSPGSSPQSCKLPVEILSADSNVYDPFDSSDSAEFFSSDDSDSDSDSDYGSHRLQRDYDDEDDNSSLDDASEEGIVFGAPAPKAVSSGTDDNSRPSAAASPSLELPSDSVGRSSRHGRKGTLGAIDFAYDEKDEERELAKTAGTPAFFAPELCCTNEELADILNKERSKRQAQSKGGLRHRHNTDPLVAAAISSQQDGVDNEQHAGTRREAEGGNSHRPTSLHVESSSADLAPGLSCAGGLGSDSQRVPSNPRSMKRHSMLTSLLARPFSARSRSSANNNSNSNRSSTNEGQLDDMRVALDMSNSPESSGSAEEELPSNVITPAIDIWAIGVTLYCLIYGRVPFQASTEFELFNIIPHKQLEFPDYLEVDDDEDENESSGFDGLLFNPPRKQTGSEAGGTGASSRTPDKQRVKLPPSDPDLCDLLRRLLDKDFRTRITIEEIKQHPWVVRDLDHPSNWAKETDPTRRPSLVITSQEVEQAMVPKVQQSRGFRASVKQRISMLSPLGGSKRNRASQKQQRARGDSQMLSAKAKSSLDWLKIW